MNIFSSFHLKILVIRRTKLQAFLSKQNKRVKITTSTQRMALQQEKEMKKMISPLDDDGGDFGWSKGELLSSLENDVGSV